MSLTLEDFKKLKPSQLKSSSLDWTTQDENDSFWITALAWKGSVTPRILWRILFVGVYGVLMHWVVTSFFPHLTLAIAPFEYSALVFSIFWGIIILGEFLNLLSIIGIFIILASGVLIAIRETLKDKPLSLKKIVDRR